jgi:hypothetical protein
VKEIYSARLLNIQCLARGGCVVDKYDAVHPIAGGQRARAGGTDFASTENGYSEHG